MGGVPCGMRPPIPPGGTTTVPGGTTVVPGGGPTGGPGTILSWPGRYERVSIFFTMSSN